MLAFVAAEDLGWAGLAGRQVVAAELAGGTIETVLAKSDLELGIETLMRGLRP
jgi:hypothetical protein